MSNLKFKLFQLIFNPPFAFFLGLLSMTSLFLRFLEGTHLSLILSIVTVLYLSTSAFGKNKDRKIALSVVSGQVMGSILGSVLANYILV